MGREKRAERRRKRGRPRKVQRPFERLTADEQAVVLRQIDEFLLWIEANKVSHQN